MKARFNLFLGTLAVIGMTQAANAADAIWTGLGADSLWATTGNWSTSPVPGAGNTATFNSAGNSKTTITTAPAALYSYVFNTGAAAYTISGASTTWAVPNGGGVTVNSGVTTDQNLSGIQFIRPASGSTTNFSNQATSTTLKLGTIFNSNAINGNALLKFTPTSGATIEVITGKTVDNGSIAGRTVSILLDDAGILKMTGTGNFTGTDADGNSVTIRQGTLQASTINNAAGTRSSLGLNGRIQFGKASTTNTATLDYYSAANTTTDRAFYIIDNNTAVFKVSGGASTNLAITTAITQSAATNGGGKLTKDGVGILTLSAANTFTGDTVISNGKIALGIGTALQNSAYDTTGSTGAIGLDVTGQATPTLGGLKGSVNLATAVTGYGSVSSLTLNPQTGKSNTYSGVIGEGATGMALLKTGAGTQVLTGNNEFTGNVTISAGRLTLGHSNALGTGPKGLIMQGTNRSLYLTGNIVVPANIDFFVSSSSADGGGINNESGNNQILAPINISNGNPALNISSASGTLTLAGNVTLTTTSRTLYLGGASTDANTISGIIGQSGVEALPVTKQGTGTWVISNNNNSYTGATTVTAGKLVVNGNISTSSLTTVKDTAILGGSGTVAGVLVESGGKFAPGNSPGTLTFAGSLTLDSGSISDFEINAFTSGNYDLAVAQALGSQTVNFNSGILNLLFQSGFSTNGTVKIFDFDTYAGLGFGTVNVTGLADGYTATFNSTNGIVTVIPEPSAAALVGGLGMLALLRRRRA
jgi:autotransporter-associated beta strand protein